MALPSRPAREHVLGRAAAPSSGPRSAPSKVSHHPAGSQGAHNLSKTAVGNSGRPPVPPPIVPGALVSAGEHFDPAGHERHHRGDFGRTLSFRQQPDRLAMTALDDIARPRAPAPPVRRCSDALRPNIISGSSESTIAIKGRECHHGQKCCRTNFYPLDFHSPRPVPPRSREA